MLKEILSAVAMASGGFLFVMVAGNLLRGPLADVLGGRVPFSTFLELTLLLIPSMAPYVMPIGILTGVLLVLGRMSAQNEITAMKASGMSLWRIAAPIVAIGVIGTVAAVFINCEYTPRANTELKRRGMNAIRENPVDFIGEKTPVTDFPGFLIYAGKRDDAVLRDIWIWRKEKLPGGGYGRDTEVIRAESAEVSAARGDDGGEVLRIRLSNAVVERLAPPGAGRAADPVAIAGTRELPLEIPVGKIFGVSDNKRKLRWYTTSELLELREKGFELPPNPTEKERLADRMKVQFQIQSSISNAFGILSLTLLAIPLGIRVSRSETFVNFGVALALALTYYLLTVFMSWIRNPDFRPDLLVWLPNIIIQAVAFRLLHKAAKS